MNNAPPNQFGLSGFLMVRIMWSYIFSSCFAVQRQECAADEQNFELETSMTECSFWPELFF